MSLRSVGNQLLQTAPSTLLLGASTASLSFWVRVNVGCNVANTIGVEIFGDSGGKLSARLSGSGTLQLGWLSQAGGADGSSSCSLTLVPGTSYHIAATWQAGAQRYYLNGVQVHVDTQSGSIGVVGDTSPRPFRLGSDSAGTDVTVDEPTLWVGYSLSAQDVLDLRDRAVGPQGIAPSSIVLQWSLAGTDGVAARAGDAGLLDGSPTGLNLSTIVGGASTYQAGVLSYVPPARIGVAAIPPSGEGLYLVFEDSSGNPTDVASLRSSSDEQTLTVDGLPAGAAFTLTFEGQTTAPIPVATNLPAGHALWGPLPVAAGTPYGIYATWPASTNGVNYQVFDGSPTGAPLAANTINEQVAPVDITYGVNGDGVALGWGLVATVTSSTGSLYVLIAGEPGGNYFVYVDGLLTRKVSDGSILAYDDGDPSVCSFGPTVSSVVEGRCYKGSAHRFSGNGTTDTYSASASDIQAALLALSSVPAGSLTVSTSDNLNYAIAFTGPMRDLPQPPITSSDPAITIAHTIVGADVPSIIVNGGPPIKLLDWIWGISNAPSNPYAYCPFQQAAKTPQILKVAQSLTTYTGSGWVAGGGGSGGITFFSNSPGDGYFFSYQGLPPGIYQLAATWSSTISPPGPYAGLPLSTNAQFLVEDISGTTLGSVVVNQTQAPADFNDAGVGWKILGTFTIAAPINGLTVVMKVPPGATHPIAADGVRLARISPDNSLKISPADGVTISVPDGWASTSAGVIGQVVNLPLMNQVGQNGIVPFVADAKTMKVGYNIEIDTIAEYIYRYSNLANRIQGPLGLTYDNNQYPLTSSGPSISNIPIIEQSPIDAAQSGYYTFLWDGAVSDISIQGYSTDAAEVVALRKLTGTTNNRRVFNLQPIANNHSPAFALNVNSTKPDPSDLTHTNYLHDLQNLRIYPPDPSDPTGMTWWQAPPKFHPFYTGKMLAGVQCLRLMDSIEANNSGIHDYTDLIPASRLGYFVPRRIVSIPVVDYRGYSGDDPAFDISSTIIIQITTGTPHGFVDGQVVTYAGPGTVTLSNGSTYPASYAGSNVRVLSPTVILIRLGTSGNVSGSAMTNVLSGGAVGTSIGGGMPWTDMIELANTIPSVTDLWVNIPFPASDACVTSMGTYVAQNLKPGCKVHVEFSNEAWNLSFFNWYACCALTRVLGLGDFNEYAPSYVYRAKQVHDLFSAAMAAYGRGGDMIRTFGAQGTYADNSTVPVLAAAIAQGRVPIDEIATAPYFGNGNEPGLQYLFDLQTVDQDHDLLSLNLAYDGYIEQETTGHRTILDANGYTSTKIVNYEGGPDVLYPQPTSANNESRNHAIARHPRMYWWMLSYLQSLQDHGVTLFNDFYVAGRLDTYAWAAWFNWDQQAGTGNPTLDALNLNDPESVFGIKSEVGGAMKLWGSLASPTPPTPRRSIPGRNGQLKTTGYPRGLFRPTR